MPTFNTTDPKPGYVYDSDTDTWYPLLGLATQTLDGLTDVIITSPATNQSIVYNGTNWVNSTEVGDITEVVAGTGLSGGGTSGSVTLTNTVATTLDAAGDIIYASAADTPAKLSIGTAGQVLKVNSGATAPEWGTVAGSNLKEVVFTSSNTSYAIPSGVTGIWALVVGAGGGGGASGTATAANGGGGGGAGAVVESYFSISGDTTLNITVGAGGAGGTAGGKGSTGATSSIVGNTSSTTYATAAGGGGGGGGTGANNAGISGASGGGNGFSTGSVQAGGGGGFKTPAIGSVLGFYNNGNMTAVGSGAAATTNGVTGYAGGTQNQSSNYGGEGIIMWNRRLAAGGNSASATGIQTTFGAGNGGVGSGVGAAGGAGTANSGSGGGAGNTSSTTAQAGGAGGSGLVVLRYVGA
jgi:hypothetical protein